MGANKLKILTISDHPLVPSGVATQTRYIIEGLLKTGKYQFRSLGGAMSHHDYRPLRIQEYGEDWIIFPINGYGDETIIREILDHEKPDAIWFMTDPRFYGWLINMSDEIRDRGIPMLYYHVWDNYPVPKYNKNFYKSCDYIGCISKLTHDIVKQLGFEQCSDYIPHAVDMNIFKPLPKEDIIKIKEKFLDKEKLDRFVVFYNSRNARRKMTSDVVKDFKMFTDIVGEKNTFLLMHTDPFDHEGANLVAVCEMLGLKPDNIAFSNGKLESPGLAEFYNIADVTINISNNEGFGLSALESLCCNTPVVVNKTGGLQDQAVDDDGVVLGACIEPATRSLTGSQEIPYIFDDRCADKDVVDALVKLFNMSYDERKALGARGRQHAEKNFSMKQLIDRWDAALQSVIEKYKSGKNPNRVKFTKV